jgi:putative ABC transport system permease protein
MANIPELTMDMVTSYGNSEYVKSYNYSIQTELNSTSIEKVTSTTTNSNIGGPQISGNKQAFTNSIKVQGDFKVVGYSSLDAMTEFINSTYKITSGSIFDISSTDNSCVISEELADENNLTVGSTFTMVNPNNSSETYTFKVTGIYQDSSQSSEFSMFSNSANKILTTYGSVNAIAATSNLSTDTALKLDTNATFNLKSKDVIDSFTSELTQKGLSSYYTVTTNLDGLDSAISPIQNLASFSNVFLILVLLIGGVILVVINMINIRERKYEIGVLRAIGMKKHKVLQQFVIELFVVTFISIIIGTGVGSILTVPIANHMLASEVSAQESASSKVNKNFGMNSGNNSYMNRSGNPNDIRKTFSSNSETKYIDKINAVIDIKTVGELILIGIMLTIVSSSISMISISRYTPLKILSSRT